MSRFAQSASRRTRACTAALAALGVLTTATLLTSSSASAAVPSADGLQTNVYYTFQDLASEHGTRALYRRIVSAARTVCPGYDSSDLDVVAASKECQRNAIARAIGQIGNARLAAIDARESSWRG